MSDIDEGYEKSAWLRPLLKASCWGIGCYGWYLWNDPQVERIYNTQFSRLSIGAIVELVARLSMLYWVFMAEGWPLILPLRYSEA